MKSVKLAVVSASTALSVLAVGTAVTGAEEAKVSACAAAESKASASKEKAAAAQAYVDKKSKKLLLQILMLFSRCANLSKRNQRLKLQSGNWVQLKI
ncbi:hypothetical protein [Corynebacterium diphtheriae]|uniref:hypothetical protein n=1 Tax=Corynebacterium diphtheriae TaxID=1717 RepID=UPI00041F8E41|nr:hypothetical protein [Corynebacterium diphtheriae]UEB41427.1 hypothetical protein LK405_01450 [Corynebacterium diphtheriae]